MPRNIKRLSLAFALSAICFYGVEYWYKSLELGVKIRTNQEPVARLVNLNNEVQRKPVTRLIWEVISKNENLFPGEAIRTTSSSDATILFINSGTTIELEPDSQVIIQESDDQISLDFVKGNLFVKQDKQKGTGGDAKAIKLKTKKGDLDLNNADIALSQSDKGVDLQVYSGKANLVKDGQTIQLDSKSTDQESFFKLISPLPNDPAFISPQNKEPVTYKWKELPEGYQVFVERGPSRSQLTRYEGAFAKGEDGLLAVPTTVGKIYWRLVAVPTKQGLEQQVSQTVFSQVVAKTPPVLLQPEPEQKIVLIDEKSVNLKWTTKGNTTGLVVEIAADPGLKKKVLQKSLNDKVTGLKVKLQSQGLYYWRVTGFIKIKDKMEPVSSPIQSFKIAFEAPLIPPELMSPALSQVIPYEKAISGGVYFTWKPVEGMSKYKVKISEPPKKLATGEKPGKLIAEKEVDSTTYLWSDMSPGSYIWEVSSINNKDEVSKPSPSRIFQIGNIPEIKWTTGAAKSRYQYVTATPSLFTSWEGTTEKATSWRYRLAGKDDFIDTAEWIEVTQPQVKTAVPKEGLWSIEVEALDLRKAVIARSKVKEVMVVEKPLLRGPAYAPNMARPMRSSPRGTIKVKWSAVQGAKKYHVKILDSSGAVVNNFSADVEEAMVRSLQPGKYKVSVQSVDEHDRIGPAGEVRELVVPDGSNIAAPKIKKINVK